MPAISPYPPAPVPETISLPVLREAAQRCKACDLFAHATQVVFGEGKAHAPVLFVGEQPGDAEDRAGRPFVGPAGKLWDVALDEAGLDRATVYVTNAVKHFYFEERGKRRLHKTPRVVHVSACKPWLEAEIDAVQPCLIVALGATAALAVVGHKVAVQQERGHFRPHPSGAEYLITVHPSFLLRIPEPAQKEEEYGRFVADLKQVAARLKRAGK